MALKNNTWKLNQWYDQAVAGTQGDYSGEIQLWGWGRNNHGQLGVNDKNNRSSPVQIPGTTWVGGAIGRKCQYQVKTDGTLWAWGSNAYGQLMHNNRTNISSPKQVPGTTWSGAFGKISGSFGGTATLIKTDGTMWSVGRNDEGGEIGDNANISRSSPVQIPGTTWSKVARGQNHAFAIKTDGTLWAWGYNGTGRLGINLGSGNNRSSPTQVGSDTTWTDVSATSKSSFGIKTDGTLWSWGHNTYGNLGQNQAHNVGHCSSPKQIPGTTWSLLARGGVNNMVAIKTDGTLWVWGNDEYGNNNNNDGDIDRSSPTQVPGTTWHQLSGTNNGFFAIKQL